MPPTDAPPLPGDDRDPMSRPLAAPCVLVVDDEALNRTIACSLLEHVGYRVEVAADAASALAALRRQRFDVVLMDWHMPGMDGIEVTRRVRAGEAGEAARGVPIVALTANAFAHDRAACLAAGMDDFLSKPIDGERLARTVARWSRPASSNGPAATDPPG